MLYLCIGFEKDIKVTFAVKPTPIMKMNLFTLKEKAQDFVLRLFVESSGEYSSSQTRYYTCAHAGTHARLHQ